MQNMLSGLAALHQLAASRGDGLIPELLELAQRDQRVVEQGAVRLNVPTQSSGPAQHFDATGDHSADNVTVLHPKTPDSPSEKTG